MNESTIAIEVERFHGHMCPGVAIGVQAANVALAELGCNSDSNEVLAIVETSMCAVDGIQYVMGCTFGRGTLIHLDYGKNAYSFVRTGDGKSLRLSAREGAWQRSQEHEALLAKSRAGLSTESDKKRYWELQRQVSEEILARHPESIFRIVRERITFSALSRDMHYRKCSRCGDMTNVSRLVSTPDSELCVPCANAK